MVNILILSAHPDDEVLGMGATIKKLSKKNKIFLCVVSEGASAQYKNKKMIEVRRNACIKSGKLLGISKFKFLNFPDLRLDSVPQLEINIEIEKIVREFKPEIIYTVPPNDLNADHKIVFESALIVGRPLTSTIKKILCYEVCTIVRTPFEPNIYENVENEIKYKLNAFKIYKSEVREFPHSRSLKAIENLATQRGIESGLMKAEAFQLIREIV